MHSAQVAANSMQGGHAQGPSAANSVQSVHAQGPSAATTVQRMHAQGPSFANNVQNVYKKRSTVNPRISRYGVYCGRFSRDSPAAAASGRAIPGPPDLLKSF